MKKIALSILAILWFSFYHTTFAWVLPGSSWLKGDVMYEVEWCSPHKSTPAAYAIPLDANGCVKSQFNTSGWAALLNYTWLKSSGLLDYLADELPFNIKAEGITTVRVSVQDWAGNITVDEMVFKVDKMSPYMWFVELIDTDNSPYIYEKEESEFDTTVELFNTSEHNSFDPSGYTIYAWKPSAPAKKTLKYSDYWVCPDGYRVASWGGHVNCYKAVQSYDSCTWEYKMTQQDVVDGQHWKRGSGTPIKNTNLSQYIDSDLGTSTLIMKYVDSSGAGFCNEFTGKTSATKVLPKLRFKQSNVTGSPRFQVANNFSDSYEVEGDVKAPYLPHSENTSGISKIEVYSNSNLVKTISSGLNQDISLQPSDFNVASNDYKFITLRVYDNAGNYSEQAFEAYRDETTPLVNNNFDFKLNGDDQNIVANNKISKFIKANNNIWLTYTWWSDTRNTHMANIKLQVESDGTGIQEKYLDPTATSQTKNVGNYSLTKIDSELKNQALGQNFREYTVTFKTDGITGNKVCDAVGNCINGEEVIKQFRAIANDMNLAKSSLDVQTPTQAYADNASKYVLSYDIQDQWGNKIRQVYNGNTKIKESISTLQFENNLNTALTDNYTDKVTNPVTVSVSDGLLANNINNSNENIILKEAKNTSDGLMNMEIVSVVPTYKWYKFLKSDTHLLLESIKNDISYDSTQVYQPSAFSNIVSAGTSDAISINGNITEESDNRYNMLVDSNYWKVVNGYNKTNLNIFNTKKLNLEYATPKIYHAQNLNILRDGIDSEHTKSVKSYKSVSNMTLKERYFDVQNINSNVNADFYRNNAIKNNFTNLTNFENKKYKVRYEAKEGKDFDKWWYVSYLEYYVWGKKILLPSISRWVVANAGDRYQSSAFYPNIAIDTSANLSFLTKDVSIDGLVNDIDGWATSNVKNQEWLVSLDMERPYTRAELLEKVKKKSSLLNRQDKWCNENQIDVNFEDFWDCTFEIEWETVTFIEWNTELTGWVLNKKRSIIVKDGSLKITGNISTFNTTHQLFIASISNKWLENVNLDAVNEITQSNKKWWIGIDENVTNIDAFIFAQWPIVSTKWDQVINNYTKDDQLLNQLHIYGSVFSLNTVGGAKTAECPYIEDNCDDISSKVYDLSFLRRYTLVDAAAYGWAATSKVPYDNDMNNHNTLSSGGCNYNINTWLVWCNNSLRKPKSSDHEQAPVIIQRDQIWSINPTYFSKDD